MSLGFRFRSWAKRTVIEFGKLGFLVTGGGVGYLAFDTNVATVRRVEGPSMSPALNTREYEDQKFEDRNHVCGPRDRNIHEDFILCTRKFEPQRGDIVLVEDPKNRNSSLVKRIIGLGGDTIVPLGFNQEEKDKVTLSDHQVWVESDAGSFKYRDSGHFGPVHKATLQGKALYAINPFNFSFRALVSEIPSETEKRLTINSQ